MALRKVYGQLLLPFIENYKSAGNATARTQVVKNAVEAVSKAEDLLEEGVDLPKDLHTVNFFYSVSLGSPTMLTISGHYSLHQRPDQEGSDHGGWGSETEKNQANIYD